MIGIIIAYGFFTILIGIWSFSMIHGYREFKHNSEALYQTARTHPQWHKKRWIPVTR